MADLGAIGMASGVPIGSAAVVTSVVQAPAIWTVQCQGALPLQVTPAGIAAGLVPPFVALPPLGVGLNGASTQASGPQGVVSVPTGLRGVLG